MTTYKELYSRVLSRLGASEGEALLAAQEAINDAQRYIARTQDFAELMVDDTSGNAVTSNGTAEYDLANDWGFTRPKDIYSLRLMSNSSSRKLTFLHPKEIDELYPYPEILGNQISSHYTTKRKGKVILYPTPDSNYSIYTRYSQWPANLANDTDETQFEDIDDVIVTLGTEIAWAALNKDSSNVDWVGRARQLLGTAVGELNSRPDVFYIARPFQVSRNSIPQGEYWKQPFVRRDP